MAYAPPRVIGEVKDLNPEVIKKLEVVAKNTGKDVKVISGYEVRVHLEGKNEGKPRRSAHNDHIAVDVQIDGLNSEQIAKELEKARFSGIGR
jgi:uncharacterized protein YcbK (DUF882 family)